MRYFRFDKNHSKNAETPLKPEFCSNTHALILNVLQAIRGRIGKRMHFLHFPDMYRILRWLISATF
jgi:hypothetical protein